MFELGCEELRVGLLQPRIQIIGESRFFYFLFLLAWFYPQRLQFLYLFFFTRFEEIQLNLTFGLEFVLVLGQYTIE